MTLVLTRALAGPRRLSAGATSAVLVTTLTGHLADKVRPRSSIATGAVALAARPLAPLFIRTLAHDCSPSSTCNGTSPAG